VKFPTNICRISEQNFWSSLRKDQSEALADAVALGCARKKKQAYARLGEFHRHRLAEDLAWFRTQSLPFENNPAQSKITVMQKPEDLLRHRIMTWHTSVAQFDEEIDWNYAHTDQYGFHYLCWLVPGVRRLLDKGEDEYRECLQDIVASYYNARNKLQHPIPPMHLVYGELGSWCKTLVLLPLYLTLLELGDLPADVHEAFMKLFLGFARALSEEQKKYRSGNWQVAGSSALFILARTFSEFEESTLWEQQALDRLHEHLQRDFFADGGHEERCWSYGLMSLNAIEDAYRTGMRHGGLGAQQKLFRKTIERAYSWYESTLGPTGLMPGCGDGALCPGNVVLEAAAAFRRETKTKRQVDRSRSVLLESSGFVIMRNGGHPDSSYLNLSFGRYAGWHSHMDCLALNFWSLGEPLIEEFGMLGGYGEALSILARAPESHNQLTIDGMHYDCVDRVPPGKERPRLTGCAWNEHPDFALRTGRDVCWFSTPEIDFFSAWHGAYRANWREPQTVDIKVRRTVIFVKDPGYVLVSDCAFEEHSNNEGPNFSVTQNWHSPFPFKVLSPGIARTTGRKACLLAFAPQPYLRRLEAGVDYAGDEAAVSKDFPERYNLRARRWMPVEYRGATGVTSVLYPFQGKAPDVSIEVLPLDGEQLFRTGGFAITTPHGRDVFYLNPERLPGVAIDAKEFKSRARVRLDKSGQEIIAA
jgi:hypothetical protein